MKSSKLPGRPAGSTSVFGLDSHCRPNPIVTFSPLYIFDKKWSPAFGDRHALLLLRRVMPKKVSFQRAYTGWRLSGAREEAELGEGRAFFRWLQKHELSVDWKERDFSPHPYFCHPDAPVHDPDDEMARGLSFAIRPVDIEGRKIKLYVRDNDMLSLLQMPYGKEENFLELVMRYVASRFEWESWRAPAPTFLDWMVSHGKRPIFEVGQLGFRAPYLPALG